MYYHGTSSALGITEFLLPPEQSARLSEFGRKRNLDKVFFTLDVGSAKIYARKAAKRFGGKPLILKVNPIGEVTVLQATPGTTVLMADKAEVISD